MEKTIAGDWSLLNTLVGAGVLTVLIFAMVVIAFGVEAVAPGVHDTFHDFRHIIGMPCH